MSAVINSNKIPKEPQRIETKLGGVPWIPLLVTLGWRVWVKRWCSLVRHCTSIRKNKRTRSEILGIHRILSCDRPRSVKTGTTRLQNVWWKWSSEMWSPSEKSWQALCSICSGKQRQFGLNFKSRKKWSTNCNLTELSTWRARTSTYDRNHTAVERECLFIALHHLLQQAIYSTLSTRDGVSIQEDDFHFDHTRPPMRSLMFQSWMSLLHWFELWRWARCWQYERNRQSCHRTMPDEHDDE